jgi:hypothetical protein
MVTLQQKYLEVLKVHDYQKYMLLSLEQQNLHLSDQMEALEALMQQTEVISKLKLRERGILLVELSEQVNTLRRIIRDWTAKKHLNTAASQSSALLPRIESGLDVTVPETFSPARLPAKELDMTSQSMPDLCVRPATVGNRQLSAAKSSSRGHSSAELKRATTPLHNKPFTSPLYNVKIDSISHNGFVLASPTYEESSPIVQTNFLRRGEGRLKRPNMFAASSGAQGKVYSSDLPVRISAEASFYSEDNNSLIEEAPLTMDWLGMDEKKVAEINQIRHLLVKSLTDSAKLKKKHMMATAQASIMKGKGREVRLKLNAANAAHDFL